MANPEKAAAVAELTERFRGSSAGVLTEYRGLSVGQLSELRRVLGDNATYAVVKNTLTAIAAATSHPTGSIVDESPGGWSPTGLSGPKHPSRNTQANS